MTKPPKHTGQPSPYSDETHLVDAERTRELSYAEIDAAVRRTEETLEMCRLQIRRNEALLGLLKDALPGK